VSELTDLLSSAGASLEPEIRRRLGGLLGGIIRAYLPQGWVFKTDRGTATLTVDAAGAVSVAEGASAHPDVTIEIPFEILHKALTTRQRDGLPKGPVHVTPHTSKGRAAFDYLRGRIGL
jgi:hypothetical protein